MAREEEARFRGQLREYRAGRNETKLASARCLSALGEAKARLDVAPKRGASPAGPEKKKRESKAVL